VEHSKQFASLQDANQFVSELPPIASVSCRHRPGQVTVRWRPLRLRMIRADGGANATAPVFDVKREIEHAYLIRPAIGPMIKVNRYTLASGGQRFELV